MPYFVQSAAYVGMLESPATVGAVLAQICETVTCFDAMTCDSMVEAVSHSGVNRTDGTFLSDEMVARRVRGLAVDNARRHLLLRAQVDRQRGGRLSLNEGRLEDRTALVARDDVVDTLRRRVLTREGEHVRLPDLATVST